MTAPARSRTRARSARRDEQEPRRARAGATVTEPARPVRGRRPRTERGGRTTAAERAYARRAQRAGAAEREEEQGAAASGRKRALKLLRLPTSRASFVLVMMGLLAAGVATTLWLSTQAIADSYRLEELRRDNATLAERAEQLERDVTRKESSSSLAEDAKKLGMVPVGDLAHIVVNPDGTVRVVGEPKKTDPKAQEEPTPPEDVAPPAQPTVPDGTTPAAGGR
ncbi:hypothetical protein [Amycolatopsis suaedae]|uniref:Cell division protein FtsL n=1 Tax=Amycolatopsis suaedae TaxID=2510978 RepID=A0A4Q7J0H9_9PSEU|nr:hypothetical protein [Amycolatopsis suaedae]RZQ59876.1 hypothetical protein EWH70_32725 [Amycolatopsis suaedae]